MAQAAGITIPPLIKRNTLYFAVSQACIGMATQLTPTLAAIMVMRLLGSATLAGVGVSITWGARFLVAYPTGMIMDRYGRRVGLILGMVVTLIGAIGIGLSMAWMSFPMYLAGLLVFGIGAGAAHQVRLAAADMYPPSRRAEGMGFVLMGGLAGAFGGPALIGAAEAASPSLQLDPLAITWLLTPVVIIPSILLVLRVRPDPKEIATRLEQYYPGYTPPSSTGAVGSAEGNLLSFIRHYPKLVAFISSFALQGNMAMMMTVMALVLADHGHALPAISLSVAFHFVGMFGLSVPLGGLADRFGRRAVMLAGMFVGAAGSLLVPATPDYWLITLGGLLVGLGWSCVNVAATAVIADTTNPLERGRAVGTNDSFSAAAMIVSPLIAGPVLEWLGLWVLGFVAAGMAVVPAFFLLRLVETSPGRYLEPAIAAQR